MCSSDLVHAALGKLHRLEEEEPQLHVVWNETLGEIHEMCIRDRYEAHMAKIRVKGSEIIDEALPYKFGTNSADTVSYTHLINFYSSIDILPPERYNDNKLIFTG